MNFLYNNFFLITLNYGTLQYKSHLNIWYDYRVTAKLDQIYRKREKDRIFLTRKEALGKKGTYKMEDSVDYIFDRVKERLSGDLTLPLLLQILQRDHAGKEIYIFGLDLYYLKNQEKWYDNITSHDKDMRDRQNYKIQDHLDRCSDMLDKYVKRENVFNCNLLSGYKGFQFGDVF